MNNIVQEKIEIEKSVRPSLAGLLMWVIPASAGAFLLLFRLADVAGLHRDEATFGLFAEMIQNGFRPLRGYFNFYTSPVHSYIIALFFSLFGESIWSLRASGVLFNLVAVWAYIDVLRRISPREALWTLWFLVTLPAFIVMSRIAGENYAMNPLFLFGGIWCFYVLGLKGQSKWVNRAGYFLTGFSFFLGCWNHIVFAPAALTVVIVYLIASRIKITKISVVLLWFAAGAIIGAIPKLYGAAFLGYPLFPATGRTTHCDFREAFLNMVYTLGGDALYIRACGKILFSVNWFLPLCVLGLAGVVFRRDVPPQKRKIWIAAAACAILSFLGTLAITPNGLVGSRIWLLPLWFVPLLLASALSTCPKMIRVGLGTAIIITNIAAISVNYFYNFLQDKGTPLASVYVGGRYDNSWDFIDLRPLVNKLADYNNKPIYIEDFNADRLKFLLPADCRTRAKIIEDLVNNDNAEPGSIIAFYNIKSRIFPPKIDIGRAAGMKKEELCTLHYVVFEIAGVK
ncbi:MAG: glycosyltransferase family 39 protein [Phycisphaerae bacterium]